MNSPATTSRWISRIAVSFATVIIGAWLTQAFGQLSGTKTIGGTAPDYPTIKSAIQDLRAQGVTSPGVTFLIRDGVYNEDSLRISTTTASMSAPITIKPDVGATVTINVTGASTTVNYGISIDTTSYVTIDGSNAPGGTSRDMTVNALGTNGSKGIRVYGNSDFCVVKNVVVSCGGSLTSTTTRGVDVLYSGPSQPDNSLVQNVYVKRAGVGVRIEGNISTDRIIGGAIENCEIATGAGDSVGVNGIFSFYADTVVIRNNVVRNLFGTGTIAGIQLSSYSPFGSIYNNDISGVITSGTASTSAGIQLGGTQNPGSGSRVFNNFVSNIDGNPTGTGLIYGLYITSTSTTLADTFYYNSVNMTGGGTGNRTTAAFAFTSTTATHSAVLKNNILKNTRSDVGTSLVTAIRKSGTTTTLISSNNDLYVGPLDANHITGLIGTTQYSTLADWQTGSGGDAGSLSENPPYLSAIDLHLNTATPTGLEGAGTPVSVATDIDNDSRNATTPDIGADEGSFMGVDVVPPTIAHTALGSTNFTGNRVAIASITDASGIASGSGAPQLWHKNSTDTTYANVNADSTVGNNYYFTIPGRSAGTTVNYYLGAQDASPASNVATAPAGGSGINPPGSTPPGTVYSYLVQAAIPGGTYTVGSGGAYPDLASAFADVSANGISGPVTLSLTDNQYIAPGRQHKNLQIAEPEYMTINGVREFVAQPSLYGNLTGTDSPDTVGSLTLVGPIAGASATNRITIRPAAGTSVEINGTGNPVLKIQNASYVTVDGINTGGASLTINSAAGTAVFLEGDADNNIVQNLRLRSPNFTAIILAELAGANTDNNLIIRNTIGPAFNGAFLMSGAATANGLNNRITLNNFGTPTDSIAQAGVIVQNATGTSVDNNTIQNIVRTTATGNALGIGVQTKHFNTQIYNNVVKNVAKIGGTAASTVSGITAFGTAGDTTTSNIYNNMIYNLDNLSTSTSSLIRGLYLSSGLRDTVAYNSVSIAGTDAASIVTAALVVGFPNTTAEQTWHNNIGINARTATGTGRALAFYSNTASGQYLTNYNDLYVTSQAGSHVAAVTTTNYTALGDWQGTGRDANSISEMPNFVAPDLHIDANIPTGLNAGATPLPGFTVDFDGANRNAATPDIGADEFNQAPAGFVIFEEFEGTEFPPTGWSRYIVTGDSGWIHTTTFPLNGSFAARNSFQPPGTLGSKFLVTKRVDLMPGSTYELSFWMRRQFTTAFPPDTVYIRTSTTDSLPASFGSAIYKCYTGTIGDTATDPNIYGLVYRQFRTTITDPNVKYVAFDHQDNDGQTIFMDDVALRVLLGSDIGVTSVASAAPVSAHSDVPEHGSRNPEANRAEKVAAEQGRVIVIAPPVFGPIILGSTTQGSVTLEARVANFGGVTENSYQVGWSIDGVPQADVSNTDPLEVGDSDTLALVWSTATPGMHTARAWSILAGDTDASNDTSGVYSFEVLGSNVLLSEGFNDPTFPPAGWTTINRDGGGTTGPWFAGNVTVFPPFEGAGYAADNFNTANGFYIDDYLVTPNVTGPAPGPNDVDSLTFWMRSPDPNNFPDSLMILVSTTGTDTSNFTVNLGYYNAPTSWTRFAFALPNGANRYVAFRYLIYNGGPSGNNSNYIGLDDVRITRHTVAPPVPVVESFADHTTSTMKVSVTNEGNIGSLNAFVGTGPGSGFQFNPVTSAGQRLFEGALIIATDSSHVSNAARTEAQVFDADFKFLSNIDTSGSGNTRIYSTSYTDSLAESPIGVRVDQVSVSIDSAGLSSILWMQMDVTNTTASALTGMTVGGFFDWDVNPATAADRGQVVVDSTNTIPGVNGGNPFPIEVLELHQGVGTNSYVGVVALSENTFKARRIAISSTEVYPPRMTKGDKWRYINTNRATNPNGDNGTAVDHAQVWGHRSFNLAPSETRRVGFALVAGTTLGEIVQAARDAQRQWVLRLGNTIDLTTDIGQPTAESIPTSFDLGQNYPNPFNPTTIIRYALPEPSSVTLKIYNVLGQQVAELVNDVKDAGFFQTEWNGRNHYGQLVSSGVYFYRMEARGTTDGGVFVSEKKMLMLK